MGIYHRPQRRPEFWNEKFNLSLFSSIWRNSFLWGDGLPLLPADYPEPYGGKFEWGTFIKFWEIRGTLLNSFTYFPFKKSHPPSPFNCSGVLSSNHNLQIFFQPIRRHFLNTAFNSFKSFRFQKIFLGSLQIFKRCNRWHGCLQLSQSAGRIEHSVN